MWQKFMVLKAGLLNPLSKAFIYIVCFLMLLLSHTTRAESQLVKSGIICSDNGLICIDGELRVNKSKGLVRLTGRVTKTTKPGYLRIYLKGYSQRQIFEARIKLNWQYLKG